LTQIEETSVTLAENISTLSKQASIQSERTNEISEAMKTVNTSTSKSAEEARETASLIEKLSHLSVALKGSVAGFTLPGVERSSALN
jgi:methyl-accepting chemotaxis protein